MGWYFQKTHFTRTQMIEYLTQSGESIDSNGDVVSTNVLGIFFATPIPESPYGDGTLFVAWDVDRMQDGKPVNNKYIGVYLIEHSPTSWGYKPQDCCMGPYATGCPDNLLDLCPPHDSEWCKGFHKRQRDHNEALRMKDLAFAECPNDKLSAYIDRKKAELETKGVAFAR